MTYAPRLLPPTLLRLAAGVALLLGSSFVPWAPAAAAGTAAGTQIQNFATASYTDDNNQSYSTQSNTVTTTVQNAPSLTATAPAAQNVSPGETVVDTYTLTNTGNGNGNFMVPAAPTISSGTIAGYTLSLTNVNGTVYSPCTIAAPCSLATLQADLATASATVPNAVLSNGGSPVATLGVVYILPQTGAATSYTTTIAPEITQAAAGTAPASTSAAVSASVTDAEHVDARIDIAKSAVTPTTTTAPILYSFGINNGGFFGANDLTSAEHFLGASVPGVIAVLDKLPSTGSFQQSFAPGNDRLPTTLPTGETATVYLSTNGTTWVTEAASSPSTAYTYVALYLSGGSGGIELPGNPSGSTGSGTGVTNPQITFTFGGTQPPTGQGSSNPNLLNIANSIAGGNPEDNGAVPVIAPGVTAGTTDASITSPATTFGPTEANVTPSPSTPSVPGGASNTVLVGGAVVNSVLNGPIGLPAATGAYNGSATSTNQLDFTAASFDCTSGGTGSTQSINNGTTQCTWPTGGVAIPNTLQNNGTGNDTFTLAVTPPAGYTVALYVANGCPVTTLSTAVLPIAPYQTSGACTIGAQLATTTSGGVTTTTSGQSALAIASGASLNYIAVFAPATGTATPPFVAVTSEIAAYGSSGTAGTPGADSNDTYDTLYPGGPLQLTKSATTVTNCPAGANPAPAAGTVCPGGTITYAIAVANVAPIGQAVIGAGSANGEPAFAIAGITLKAGAVITENGTLSGSAWFTPTYGIDANVAPSYPTGTTPTYLTNGIGSTSTLHATGSPTKGPSGFTLLFNNSITAGYSGTITFQVTVQ